MAVEFHVTNATEFQNALNTATTNGEDDTIYLAAGTYQGHFSYVPPNTEHKSLTIMGEQGTTPEEVILDGQNNGAVLRLFDWSEGPVAHATIVGITAQNGNSLLGGGGGIHAGLAAYNVFVTNCIVKNNTSNRNGGGIYMINQMSTPGTLMLENNLIINNSVTEDVGRVSRGGGASLYGYSGSYLIVNNVIAGNTAQGTTDPQGGGLVVGWTEDNLIDLIGNTIYGNQANRGGGVYLDGAQTANIYNNIIYGNTATQGGDICFGSVANRVGYNNNYSSMFGTWTSSGNNLNDDPLFVDPINKDFHLQPASPMINAGTTAVPNPPGLPATDFEGNPRTTGSATDIGAYEYSPVNPRKGTIGTVIMVSGSDFGTRKGKILIGNATLTILQWTDNSIQCRLTRALPPGPYDVTIRPATKGVSPTVLQNAFTVKAPEIDSVEPTSGSIGDEITINGYYFGTKKGKVTLGKKTCKILSWEMNETTGQSDVRFVVPKGLSAGINELKVTATGVGSDTMNFNVD
jgi:hypothetical protein